LHKFREFKHFMRRMKKAMGKRDEDQQKRLEESKPQYTVDHLVKERYPAFVDAVRDMDDVLCMVFLFRCAGLSQGRAWLTIVHS
jgi:pescadillo protein